MKKKPFVVADILPESGERTIIYASRRNLNYSSQSSSIYFDDTFKIVPEFFYHLLKPPPMRQILLVLFPLSML
ncbi:hypothetical protein HZS_7576 [Henneguya salminicola]|nr:hypothetical protein HZS_7576 [Henneguya salminicola]